VLQPGDLVLAMSVSGNSPNILKAVEYAKANGSKTVGLCGFDGGALSKSADVVVHIPSTKDEYGPVEDAFSVICHIVSGYLAMHIGRPLHH
jgi:D-sedoheptulose 7-phosphate isomerase